MNNYKKYLKYKYKYYALKKQIGGNDMKIKYDNNPITITDKSKDDYKTKIQQYELSNITDTETFIKDLIIYYILNTHTNSHNYMCPNIIIDIEKINPQVFIDRHKPGLNTHNIAYRYLYRQSTHKQAKDDVTYLAEEPCGNPIGEATIGKRAKEIYQNIIGTIKSLHATEAEYIMNFFTEKNIFTNIKERYKTIAEERKVSKSTQHNVLLSDIFFWYVIINKMFTNKIEFFKKYEPNFIETPYSGSWEASSIKQQTLAADRRLNNFHPPPAPPAPHASLRKAPSHKDIRQGTDQFIHPKVPTGTDSADSADIHDDISPFAVPTNQIP
jgi:hypothetical protein